MKVYAEEVHTNIQDLTSKKNLANCSRKLSLLTQTNTNVDMRKESLEHIRTYCKLIKEILQEQGGKAHFQLLLDYMESREALMTLLIRDSEESSWQEALLLGKELLPMCDLLKVPERSARVWFNMGIAYELLDGSENREKAYQCYIKTLNISGKYAQEKKDPISLTYRILSTLKVGNMYMDVGQYTKAQQIYSGAYSYASEAEGKFHDPKSKEYMLMAMEGIGNALLGQDTEESRKKAKTILTSTLFQTINLFKEYSNPGMKGMCDRLTRTLEKL